MDEEGKYVVFKAEDLRAWNETVDPAIRPVPMAVEDAVVIRRQDLFAGPALHTYAASIALTAKLLESEGMNGRGYKLRKVADYFHDQAIAADAEGYKLPD